MAAPISAKSKGTTPATTAQRVAVPNKAPVAANDNGAATLLLNATGNVLSNDRDSNTGDILTVIAAGQGIELNNPLLSPVASGASGITLTGIYGTLLIRADGSYVYTLNAADADFQALARGATALDNFTYQVSDGNGGSDKATLKIKVTGANHGPQATDDASGSIGNVLTNDRDVDAGDRLIVTAVGKGTEQANPELNAVAAGSKGTTLIGTYGTLVIKSNGSYVYTLDTTDADYKALGKGVTGSETFTYQISDGKGGSDKATLAIKVTGLNDRLESVDDTAASGNVLSNDRDLDATDMLTVTAAGKGTELSNPAPSAVPSGTVGSTLLGTYGSLVIKADGSYAYTLDTTDADFRALGNGVTVTESFTYQASDGQGSSDKATLAIRVTGVNHQPVAMDDSGAIGNVLENDSDADALDTLSVTAAGKGAELTNPVLSPVLEQQAPGDVSTFGLLPGATVTGTYGTLAISADGSYSYRVDAEDADFLALAKGESATESFTYQVSDSRGVSDKATITIDVTGANHAPVAVDDVGFAAVNHPFINANVLTNDTDAESGDLLKVVASGIGAEISNPELIPHGSGSTGPLLLGSYGDMIIFSNGDYTYRLDTRGSAFHTLARDATAIESFSYQVSDGQGGFDTATVGITVTGLNYLVQAKDDQVSANFRETTPGGNVLSNDVDLDTADMLRVVEVLNEDDWCFDPQEVPSGSTGITLDGRYGSLQIKADGSFVYTLDKSDEDYLELGKDATDTENFSYVVTDGDSFDDASLAVTVTGSNNNPIAVNDEGSYFGNVLSNDSDIDTGSILFVIAARGSDEFSSVPSDGDEASVEGTYGTLYIESNGDYYYELDTYDQDYLDLPHGSSATEVFSYGITDGEGGLAAATLSLEVVAMYYNPIIPFDIGATS
ncbi:MAG: Ig-like domain-containing protein [Pseudomonadota bacterium]